MSEKTFIIHRKNIGKRSLKTGAASLLLCIPGSHVEEVKTCLNKVKAEHPKATHHCFAWRLGLDGNSYRECIGINLLPLSLNSASDVFLWYNKSLFHS